MKKALLLLFVFSASHVFAQPNEDGEIKKVIGNLFDAMRKFDTAAMRATFHPDARLQSALVNPKTGYPRLITESVDSFLVQVGRLKSDTLQIEERVTSYQVKTDLPLADVWAPYEFYVNGKLSHTGIDAFHLFKSTEGWKIIQICDTRKKPQKP